MNSDPLEPPRPQAANHPFAKTIIGAVALALPVFALAQAATHEPGPPSYLWQTAAAVLVLVLLNALYVAGDTAIDLLTSSTIRPDQPALQRAYREKGRLVMVCSLGSQTMRAWMILAGLIPAAALSDWLSVSLGFPGSLVGLLIAAVMVSVPIAFVNMVFAELTARSLAAANPAKAARFVLPFVRFSAIFFELPGRAIVWLASRVTRRFGASASFAIVPNAEDQIKSLLEKGAEEGQLERGEQAMLKSVFEFHDRVVREVMKPRVDIVSIKSDSSLDDVANIIQESGYSRVPVYRDDEDDVIGVVHAKDVLRAATSPDSLGLQDILRDVEFFDEAVTLQIALRRMKSRRSHMAIVRDAKYGHTLGLVTLEDIVEEVMGDIADEYDEAEQQALVKNGSAWVVGGKLTLNDLNLATGTAFASQEFDTIGGFVYGRFGRNPRKGEAVVADGFRFRVDETDGRRITRLTVEPI